MKIIEQIETVDLFPGLSGELLGVLKSLSAAEWEQPTACTGWTVKDVAAHLLGGSLGRLSSRDRRKQSGTSSTPLGFDELLQVINRGNAEWVAAARRISAPVLVQFLELTDPQVYAYFKSLPPLGQAGPSVAWAGEARSLNWFDIAREYTEKWLHQQHIREATGRPVLAQRQWLAPVLDTFLRALPYTYRDMQAPDGASLWIRIYGEAGGDWALLRSNGGWQLFAGELPTAAARVQLDADCAWRLFTKGMTPQAARERMQVEGDADLGWNFLHLVAIMA